MSSIRVLLADDHQLVRAGIRSLLQGVGGVEVVAEASDGREALALIDQHRPDVVVMDIGMPGLNGVEAAARITRDFPRVRVVVLSMHADAQHVQRALQAGAAGYLIKGAAVSELEVAVKAVARGETYLSPATSKHLVGDYLQRASGDTGPREPGPLERLTPRHREILQLIAEGSTTKEIAKKLGLSVKTVDTHRSQLMARLEIHDIAGLVRFAIRTGLVAPDA